MEALEIVRAESSHTLMEIWPHLDGLGHPNVAIFGLQTI